MHEAEILKYAHNFAAGVFQRALAAAEDEEHIAEEITKIIETSLAFAILEFGVLLAKNQTSTEAARDLLARVNTYFEEI